MMMTVLKAAALAAVCALTAALAAACGGDDPAGIAVPGGGASSGVDGFTAGQVERLRTLVDDARDEHGVAIGCATLVSVFGDMKLERTIELSGAPGEMLKPWATGTIGTLDSAGELQMVTLYHPAPAQRHAGLRRVDGEGFVCFVSE